MKQDDIKKAKALSDEVSSLGKAKTKPKGESKVVVIDKTYETDSALQIAAKLNSFTGILNKEVVADLPTEASVIKEIKALKGNDRIDISNLRNGENLARMAQKSISMDDMRWHGGGLTSLTGLLLSGTNITITGAGTQADPFIINGQAGGVGTVTSVSVVTGNGFSGTVLNPTTTPAITIDSVTIVETIYVGKHGNDANDGRTVGKAKLTIGAAITAAIALSPTVTNQVQVNIVDAADYTENITMTTAYLELKGPAATIRGKLTIGDNVNININRVINPAGDVLEKFSTGTGASIFMADYVIGQIVNNTDGGQLDLDIKRMDVPADRTGISGDAANDGHINAKIHSLFLVGNNAIGIRANVGQAIIGVIEEIKEFPAGSFTGTTAISLGDDGDVQVSLVVNRINADIAYDSDSNNASLNLFAGQIVGQRLNTGGGLQNVVVANEVVTKRVLALSANSATPAINTNLFDIVHITNQTTAITSFTTNLTGTNFDGDSLRISITGTTAVPITWGSAFESSAVILPSTTVSTDRLEVGFVWNTETSKWRCVAATVAIVGGTVTTVSVVTANGVSGSVANATTTPAITLTLGAITPTSIGATTMAGTLTLAENSSIALDPAQTDQTYTGITRTGVAGTTLAFGQLVYLAVADSRWELTDADAATTADRLIGMCVLAAAGDGSATNILLMGNIRADSQFPAMTIGSAMYVGETPGAIQVAIPTGADNVIRRVGYALTADELYFNPSMDSQTTVA